MKFLTLVGIVVVFIVATTSSQNVSKSVNLALFYLVLGRLVWEILAGVVKKFTK